MLTSLSNRQFLVSLFVAVSMSAIYFDAMATDDNQQFILDAKRQMDDVRSQIEAIDRKSVV